MYSYGRMADKRIPISRQMREYIFEIKVNFGRKVAVWQGIIPRYLGLRHGGKSAPSAIAWSDTLLACIVLLVVRFAYRPGPQFKKTYFGPAI